MCHTILRVIYGSSLLGSWSILTLIGVAGVGILLDDSAHHFGAILLRCQIVDLMLSVFFVLLNLSLNESLILTETLANLFTAAQRNILIGASGGDVFISAPDEIIAAIGADVLGLDLDEIDLRRKYKGSLLTEIETYLV